MTVEHVSKAIADHTPVRTPTDEDGDAPQPVRMVDTSGHGTVDPATLAPPPEPGPPPRVPDRYYHRLADLDQTEQVQRARGWLDSIQADPSASRGLMLLGRVGTGKSTIAGALAVELGAPFRAHFWPVGALLRALRDEIRTPDRRPILDRIAVRRVLVLDDLGAERATEWSKREVIANLIAARYDAGQPVVITSNLNPQEVVDYLGDERLTSRLRQMVDIIEVSGPDRRNPRAAGGPR